MFNTKATQAMRMRWLEECKVAVVLRTRRL